MKSTISMRVLLILFMHTCCGIGREEPPPPFHALPLPRPPLPHHPHTIPSPSFHFKKKPPIFAMIPDALKIHRTYPVSLMNKYSGIPEIIQSRLKDETGSFPKDSEVFDRVNSSSRAMGMEVRTESPYEDNTENEWSPEDLVIMNILRTNRRTLQEQAIEVDEDSMGQNEENTLFWYLLLKSLGRFYMPIRDLSIVNNSQCIADVNRIYSPGPNQTLGATLMVDSWGKLPDGMMSGNFLAMGSFAECLLIRVPRDPLGKEEEEEEVAGNFKGKYCNVYYQNLSSSENQSLVDNIEVNIPPILSTPGGPAGYFLQYGTCMPSSCTDDDLMISLNSFLEEKGKEAPLVFCQTDDYPTVEFTPGLIAMITLLSVFACLLLGGAVIDIWTQYTKNEELRKGPVKYLLVFSIYTNLEKIFKINTSANKEAITSFYGLRVLSMTWIVWCHQYMIAYIIAGNKFYVTEIMNGHWLTQIIMNGYPSVDTFFFMSGLLVAYGILKEKEISGNFNIFVFYIHRFLRLSIPILLLCGFMATFPRYLATGPWAATNDASFSLQATCQEYWWRDAFFVSNFFPATLVPSTCLPVCWYTAVDFQLFIATPFMLLPFIWGDQFKLTPRRKLSIGLTWIGVLTLVSVLITGILTGIHQFPPTNIMGVFDPAAQSVMSDKVYSKPWCRAPPYLVGMALGIFFRRDKKKQLKLQKWQVIAGWLFAAVTALAVVFGLYDYNQMGHDPGYYWPDSVFYASLHHLAWGLTIAWVVFACHYGYGGPVNSFLSHPSWQPLSRLTYCMFLIAIPIQQIIYDYNVVYPLYYSHLNKALETVGILFVSGFGAVLLSLCTEAPVLGLERHLLGRGQ